LNDDLPAEELFCVDVLPPLETYFDGATQYDGVGAGDVLVSPKNIFFLIHSH